MLRTKEIDTQEKLSFYKVSIDISRTRTIIDRIKDGLRGALIINEGMVEYQLKPKKPYIYFGVINKGEYQFLQKKAYQSSKCPTEEAKMIKEDLSVWRIPFFKYEFYIVIGVDEKTSLIKELHYISRDGKFTFKFPLPINELSIEKIAEYFEKFMQMSDQNFINTWATLIDAKEKLDNKDLDTKGTPLIKFWEKTTPENVEKLRDTLKDVNNIEKQEENIKKQEEVKKLFDTYAGQLREIKPNKYRHPEIEQLYDSLLHQALKTNRKLYKTNRKLYYAALTLIQGQNMTLIQGQECSVFAKLPNELIEPILIEFAKNLSMAETTAKRVIAKAFRRYADITTSRKSRKEVSVFRRFHK